jgi:hypothetical protein
VPVRSRSGCRFFLLPGRGPGAGVPESGLYISGYLLAIYTIYYILCIVYTVVYTVALLLCTVTVYTVASGAGGLAEKTIYFYRLCTR